jgi:hypothetical protein
MHCRYNLSSAVSVCSHNEPYSENWNREAFSGSRSFLTTYFHPTTTFGGSLLLLHRYFCMQNMSRSDALNMLPTYAAVVE